MSWTSIMGMSRKDIETRIRMRKLYEKLGIETSELEDEKAITRRKEARQQQKLSEALEEADAKFNIRHLDENEEK